MWGGHPGAQVSFPGLYKPFFGTWISVLFWVYFGPILDLFWVREINFLANGGAVEPCRTPLAPAIIPTSVHKNYFGAQSL